MTSRYSICIGQDTVTIKGHLTIREAFDFLNFYDKEGFKCLTFPKERDFDDDDYDYRSEDNSHSRVCFCITKKDLCGEYSYKADNSRIENLEKKLDGEIFKNKKLSDQIDKLCETQLYKDLQKQEDETKELKEKLKAVELFMNEEIQKLVKKLTVCTIEMASLNNENKKLKIELNPEFQKIIQGENK